MKNKSKVPKKLPVPKEVSLSDPPKVKPLEQPPPPPTNPPTTQWVDQSSAAERCRDLDAVEDILRFFRSPAPSVIDCEDVGYRAYQIAAALTEFHGLAIVGLDAEGSSVPGHVGQYAAEGIRLQLQIVRLAAKTLFELSDQRIQPKIQAPSNAS